MSSGRTVAALDGIGQDGRARLLATLIRRFGDLDLAEDSLQDAFAQALRTWPDSGVPDSPEAWLTTTAKRKALDVIRRDANLARKLAELHIEQGIEQGGGSPDAVQGAAPDTVLTTGAAVTDDQLALVCPAHPALHRGTGVLRFVGSLSAEDVAISFLSGARCSSASGRRSGSTH